MSTVYGDNKIIEPGYLPTNHVNFSWLGESWKLFRENSSVWISAVLIAFYGPAIFDGFVFILSALSQHAAAVAAATPYVGVGGPAHAVSNVIKTNGLLATIAQMPRGLLFGLILINVVYVVYMWGGIVRTAVKQVYGEPITFRDIFGGGVLFVSMFPYYVLYAVLVSVASTILLLPGLLLAGLLIPGFAMIADNYSIPKAMSLSMKALWRDRGVAMGFMFVLGAMLLASAVVIGLGLLATVPMFALISALAYRDMIGLRALRGTGNLDVDTILGVERSRGVSLTGEPLDDADSVTPPAQGEAR